jgi:hypothetical protein
MTRWGVYIQYDNGARGLKITDLESEAEAEQRIDKVLRLQNKQHKLDFFTFSYEPGDLPAALQRLNITR